MSDPHPIFQKNVCAGVYFDAAGLHDGTTMTLVPGGTVSSGLSVTPFPCLSAASS